MRVTTRITWHFVFSEIGDMVVRDTIIHVGRFTSKGAQEVGGPQTELPQVVTYPQAREDEERGTGRDALS